MTQLEQVAIAGAGLLSFSVALNAITENATCTVVFVVVGAILNFLFSSIQTLDKISWVGWVGLAGIMSSIITLAVSVGVGGRPAAAPQDPAVEIEIIKYVVRETSFVDAINAVSVVVLAYAGTPNFLNIVGEMRDQKGESIFSFASSSSPSFVVQSLSQTLPSSPLTYLSITTEII